MVCGIATYPLLFTAVFWFPSWIIAIVFGILSLKNKTTKKGFAITGLLFAGSLIVFLIVGMM